jgi:phosphoribosylformimino-5-aminoimidazole carboxamide ribotide isomerase
MLIIPAIDLKDGCVVRYVQGRRDKKVYSRDPLKTAKHWMKQGAKLIHVVDLDGANTGTFKNLEIIKKIAEDIDVPLEFGGGVRKIEAIRKLLDLGIQRVVLGTRAIEDKDFLKKAFKEFKQRVIVSLDAAGDCIQIKGWKSSHKKTDLFKFSYALKKMGFKQVIYTDTSRDGTLRGPNIQNLKKLLKNTGLGVIASGGISSLDDIYKLKILAEKGLVGVIIGKALYEGRFTLSQALKFS